MNSGRLTPPFYKLSLGETDARNKEGLEGSRKLTSDILCLGRNGWKAGLNWNCGSEYKPEASVYSLHGSSEIPETGKPGWKLEKFLHSCFKYPKMPLWLHLNDKLQGQLKFKGIRVCL